jgi:hypothetical protein
LHSFCFKIGDLFWAMLKGIKQQAVTEFLMRENEAPVEIHQWLLAFCGADSVDISTVCHCLKRSRDSGRNVDQPQSGMPVCATEDLNRWRIDELTRENWQVFQRALTEKLNIGLVFVIENIAGFGSKIVCAWWVVCHPYAQNEENKSGSMSWQCCSELEGHHGGVRGIETKYTFGAIFCIVFISIPFVDAKTQMWRCIFWPPYVFWGILLESLLCHSLGTFKDPDTFNAQECRILKDICTSVKSKHPAMFLRTFIILCNSIHPHVAFTSPGYVARCCTLIYTAWMFQCVTFLCWTTWEGAKGFRFRWDKDVKSVMMPWFQQKPKEIFLEGIHWLLCQGGVCITAHSIYL